MERADYFGLGSVALVALALMIFIIYQYFKGRADDRRNKQNDQ